MIFYKQSLINFCFSSFSNRMVENKPLCRTVLSRKEIELKQESILKEI